MRTFAIAAATAALLLSGTALAQSTSSSSTQSESGTDVRAPAMKSGTSSPQPTSPGMTGQENTVKSPAGAGPIEGAFIFSQQDRMFVQKAAQGDMAEIAAGKLALQKAKHPEIKAMAQQLIDDHTKSAERMQEMASNYDIDLPKSVGEKHEADMAKLSKLSGAEFDREWLRTQIDDHKMEIELFQAQASQQGKQTPLNKFAQAQLPILQGHLQHAQSLQSEIAGTASAK
ncbi:MAG TPA: DUF4142 domain-containing protein [Azospirillaceae bacterium]|nr:DUF4142 domain-containing protein [Azospirillaceae bacterium]